ncbi:hypothetical protein J3F83DRAFT_732377 [Trichoderma novae-zelandiae]
MYSISSANSSSLPPWTHSVTIGLLVLLLYAADDAYEAYPSAPPVLALVYVIYLKLWILGLDKLRAVRRLRNPAQLWENRAQWHQQSVPERTKYSYTTPAVHALR